MEWVTMEKSDITFGSIVRWKIGAGSEYYYAITLSDSMYINLNNEWRFKAMPASDWKTPPPDFLEVLKIEDSVPTESLLRLAQYMIEDSVNRPNLLTHGERTYDK